MDKKSLLVIILILAVGIIYRMLLTWDGNFIFNMDNARDVVDVREMVVLKQLRLTGPTSGIEGLYNGPFWYYLMAIPFIISGGNPYSAIILEIALWTIGGFFLMKIISRFGIWAILFGGSLWIASNYVILATQYALNPNPVILLAPVFFYSLEKFLLSGRQRYNYLSWILAGLFFQLEMAVGIFTPMIIVLTTFIYNKKYFLDKKFWLGPLIFIFFLLPQLAFDLKYHFIMSSSLINFLTEAMNKKGTFDIFQRLQNVTSLYYRVGLATMMNIGLVFWLSFLMIVTNILKINIKNLKSKPLALILLLSIVIPFLGQLAIPINVMPWHLGIPAAAFITLFIISVFSLQKPRLSKFLMVPIILIVYFASLENVYDYLINRDNPDPSLLKNEIAAIDYVYQKANGENFKVYIYLPSVIDYPYQYLFWWHGYNRYGYTPLDYAYLPNKPEYIRNKSVFNRGTNLIYKGNIFLIKEPNRPDLKDLWENNFKQFKQISNTMVGKIEIVALQE